MKSIKEIAKEKGVLIVAHNYTPRAVQEIADITGDSLELSRIAANCDAETILFCGVYFMAETAAILAPQKTIITPEPYAGCKMSDMATLEKVKAFKAQHADKNPVVVTYVNSSAAVKAESDICCTSSNAVKVVESIPRDATILFVPDRNLGSYVARKTGREMILFDGCCPVHDQLTAADIFEARRLHPEAPILIHPEAPAEVVALADEVLSTGGMSNFVAASNAKEFVIATETAMLHKLRRENPTRTFWPISERIVCRDMSMITPEKIERALERNEHIVKLDEALRLRAKTAVERMLAL